MYRKRRKIQSYRGAPRSGFGGSFKFVLVAVIALAVVSALITGAVLGKNAGKSASKTYGRHNLVEFGGVKVPAKDYENVERLSAVFVSVAGLDSRGFKSAVNDVENGNAVAFTAKDEAGNLCFASELVGKTANLLTSSADITASEISEIISDEGKNSVAHFYSSAFSEEDETDRILKSAEETAAVAELARAGIDEIMIFGLPDDSDYSKSLTAYMSGLDAACERTNICVVLSGVHLGGSGATRVINATEGYADSYAADFSGLFGKQLSDAIERYAYFISNYNMRVIVSADGEGVISETLVVLEAYGIDNYSFEN